MSAKAAFISQIEYAMQENLFELSTEAKEYFESLKESTNKLTENGVKILTWLIDNNIEDKTYTAKEIAEGLCSSSRTVSGAMRKLVTEGYVIKEGKDPVHYKINTEKEFNI